MSRAASSMPSTSWPRSMAGNKKLPTHGKTIPKGLSRADFTPEALEEYDRNLKRKWQRNYRSKRRHYGIVQRTFELERDVDMALGMLCKVHGITRSQLISTLILNQLKKEASQ